MRQQLPTKLDQNDDRTQMAGNFMVNRNDQMILLYRSQSPTDRPINTTVAMFIRITVLFPFADIDCCDHTNTPYYLDSYALDFFKQSSENLLIMENGLNHCDAYALLLDLHLVLSAIKTSVQVIIENETKQNSFNDMSIFLPLYRTLLTTQSILSKNFHKQYSSRNRL